MSEFKCKICKLKYQDQATAEQCQAWCDTHSSCNFHIAKQAINKQEVEAGGFNDERFNPNQLN